MSSVIQSLLSFLSATAPWWGAFLGALALTLALAVFSLVMTGIAAILLFRNCRQGKGKR